MQSGFYDLNISIPIHQFRSHCIEHLISLGYKTIALNTTVKEDSDENSKKKKGEVKEVIPAPKTCNIEKVNGQIQILQRLTVYFSDSNQLQKICKSDNAKKYDIISVIPRSSTAFQLACACREIDLISFDASNRPLTIHRKSYNLAISNCIYFEVPYVPAIGDSGVRKNTIQAAHGYHTYGKSKNVIITSGAVDVCTVRGPYDVVNLGILFGLHEEQVKHSLLNTSRSLITRAEGRRFGKTAMTMMITDLDLESEEEAGEEPAAKKSRRTSVADAEMFPLS